MPAIGSGPLHAQALAPASAPVVTLTIARQPDDAPLADVSVAVVTEACRRAGIGVVFRRMPLARSIEMANTGEVDGDLHRIAVVVQKYPNLMLVPTPTNRVDVMIYGAAATLAGKSREELRKLPVVIQRGIFVVAKYSEGMQVTDTSNLGSALEMLLNGRSQILMLTYPDAELWLARSMAGKGASAAASAGIVRWPHVWASEPMYLVLNRKRAGLVPRLDQALRDMQQEGVIQREYNRVVGQLKTPSLEPEPASAPTRKPGRG